MTRPDETPRSARRSRPSKPPAEGAVQPPDQFNLAGGAAGVLAGALALAIAVGLGYLLYERLWGAPGVGLYAAVGVFGLAGLYAGWLAGLMVYSAVSSAPERR